jgi:hypothetical protein
VIRLAALLALVACRPPEGELVAEGLLVIGPVAVAGDQVYVLADGARRTLYRIDVATGARTPLAEGFSESYDFSPSWLVIDGEELYWSTSLGIEAVRTDGGGSRIVIGAGARGVAVDGEFLYTLVAGELRRLTKATGEWTTIATGLAGADRLALAGSVVYPASSATIWRVTLDGTLPPSILATGAIGYLASEGSAVHWIEGDTLHCWDPVEPSSCPEATRTSLEDPYQPVTLAVDGNELYWVSRYYGTVKRLRSDGSVEELAEVDSQGWNHLALSPTHVWFTDPDDGPLRRIPR